MLLAFLDFINSYIFGPGLCIAVFLGGIILILRLRPFFITKPRRLFEALGAASGKSGVSPVRAMIVALAGTLGVGNIAGVASAIYIGGPGAVFWMLVSAIAALPIKYAEIVLAVRHRRIGRQSEPHGGAYFYISDRGTLLSKYAAAAFAIICVGASLAMGCAVQSSAIAVTMEENISLSPILCGIVIGILTLITASGGLSRISLLTQKLIPLMSIIYAIMSLFVIFTNLPLLGEIVKDIVFSAFSAEAVGGGLIGFITSRALRIGVTRGIVSNEAGCGTAPIAHASAAVDYPAAQGVFGMVEVFIDTIVICTMTALVVLIAEYHGVTLTPEGMSCAAAAFSHFIPFAGPVLCASVAVFAFCTIICWFFYGVESLAYLTKSKAAKRIYLALYSLCAVCGAVISSGVVWSLADLAISAMTALNLTALMLGIREIKEETDRYFYMRSNNSVPKLHNPVAKRRKM